ncbi:hypothetical protein GLW00_15375 [Halobacillus litoralis]|uniref:Uncharacterized protein n=2 Tax=Halobacillus TaxID=45667 RepID=A0A845FF22_9BACI|nr:hypothetical protein [Halobacillus sp. HZG1]MEC3884561.1 hypothetical protein [Halobacillus sp. HZG1]MYL72226.1 hypothetical protein [Halobacillus litoralis]
MIRMEKKNVQWLPIVASIGIGAATYSMMTGQAGQLQNVIPSIAKMSGQRQSNPTSNQ